ncbi:MAG TPA: hypothetical protein VIA10_12180 [Gaiellaceae bacterium]|jgi:hypothetical protein
MNLHPHLHLRYTQDRQELLLREAAVHRLARARKAERPRGRLARLFSRLAPRYQHETARPRARRTTVTERG